MENLYYRRDPLSR